MKSIVAALVLSVFLACSGAIAAEEERTPEIDKKQPKQGEMKVVRLPKMRVACIRHEGPYKESEAAWETLLSYAGKHGLIDRSTVFLGLYYDDERRTKPEMLRCDACFSADRNLPDNGELTPRIAGGREYAMATHVGSYEKLHDTYVHIYTKSFPALQRSSAPGPIIQIYRNDPKVTPEAELITEIYIPLKP